jgi:hypothetical protein
MMAQGDQYRSKAAQMVAAARNEPSRFVRVQLEWLAASYRRLAEQADRNNHSDELYEFSSKPKAEPGV